MIPSTLIEAKEYLENKIPFEPRVAIILGSGLGDALKDVTAAVEISYSEIPGFPPTTIAGHKGKLVAGKIGDTPIIAFCGRFHFYEGHSMEVVTLPVRVSKLLGANTLIVTNAAGGINPDFRAGDLMVIKDHLNLIGVSPLRGPNLDDLGPRFVPLVDAYDPSGIDLMERVADKIEIKLQRGIYAALCGPMYETAAEVKMLYTLGADAVGMSTVPEVIVARHQGMKVLGLSCITNEWGWVVNNKKGSSPSHEEVQKIAAALKPVLSRFISELIRGQTSL